MGLTAISKDNNYLTSLIQAGNDAYSNLYLLDFNGGYLTDMNQNLRVRCEGFSIDLGDEAETDRKYFVNTFYDMPKPYKRITRSFTLTFRVDSNFKVYESLLKQQSKLFAGAKGYTRAMNDFNDTTDSLFQTRVYILNDKNIGEAVAIADESSSVNKKCLYTFKKCWIQSITPLEFKNGSADVSKVSVTINFMDYEDWMSAWVSK